MVLLVIFATHKITFKIEGNTENSKTINIFFM